MLAIAIGTIIVGVVITNETIIDASNALHDYGITIEESVTVKR